METKSYNFSNIRLADLQKIASIRLGTDEDHEHKFDEWFGFDYTPDKVESDFLEKLIKRHRRYLPIYQEDTLKVKFIGVILNQVDFLSEQIHDWYHASLAGFVNGIELKGFADFMVASGSDIPETPYFFIQEFKPSIPDKHPEPQLLAEMLVAIEKNQKIIFRGGYIIGQYWKFVILEKKGENDFKYFVSESFDALKLPDLKRIYIILQAVKHKYCQD